MSPRERLNQLRAAQAPTQGRRARLDELRSKQPRIIRPPAVGEQLITTGEPAYGDIAMSIAGALVPAGLVAKAASKIPGVRKITALFGRRSKAPKITGLQPGRQLPPLKEFEPPLPVAKKALPRKVVRHEKPLTRDELLTLMRGNLSASNRRTRQMFEVEFQKKSTGELRKLTGHMGIKKYVTGAGRHSDIEHDLITAWEPALAKLAGPAQAYRSMGVGTIKRLIPGGKKGMVEHIFP